MTGKRSKSTAATVLRIIDGRLAGKEYPLGQEQRVCIGHALANDVVLRGQGTRGGTVELRLSGDAAHLRVHSGTVELIGRTLGEGEEAMLPAFLPFRFGEFVIAHGEQHSARWQEATELAASPHAAPMAPLPPPSLYGRVRSYGEGQVSRLGERFGIARAALLGVSVVLVAAAAQPVLNVVEDYHAAPTTLSSRLAEAGFTGLSVADDPAGGLLVSGIVRDDRESQRLRALVAAQGVPATVDVTSATTMAASATDMLQAQGLDARAEPAGLAGIAVVGPYLPNDKQNALRGLLTRDLPGLKRVSFRVDDSRGGDPLQAFFAGGNTGLATVVGEPGHIVTADGQRWFPGAVLPTGHRLIAVDGTTVRFEKDGRVEDIHI